MTVGGVATRVMVCPPLILSSPSVTVTGSLEDKNTGRPSLISPSHPMWWDVGGAFNMGCCRQYRRTQLLKVPNKDWLFTYS